MANEPQFFQSPLGALAGELENQASSTTPTIAAPEAPVAPPAGASSVASPDERRPTVRGDIKGELPSDAALLGHFQRAAAKYKMPINVLMALAQQESGYNPLAVGTPTKWGRAKGLMQNLDSTAKGLGINPFDAEASINGAARQYVERIQKGYSPIEAVRAHFGGDDRQQWGPKTAIYGDEVMKRASDIGQIYSQQFGTPQSEAPDRLPRAPHSRAPHEPGLPRSPRSRTGDDAPAGRPTLGNIIEHEVSELPRTMFGDAAGTVVRDQVNKLIGSGASLAGAMIDAVNPDPTPINSQGEPVRQGGIAGFLDRADGRIAQALESASGAAGDVLQWAAGDTKALSGVSAAGKALSGRRDQYNDKISGLTVAEDKRRAELGQPSMDAERKDSVVNKVGDAVSGWGARRTDDQSQGQQARDQALSKATDGGVGPLLGYVARNPIDTASSIVAPTVPYFVPGAVAGRGAGVAARAAGATEATAAAAAGNTAIITGGAAATLGNSQQVAEEVAKMDLAELSKLPAYQRLLEQGMTDQQARTQLADRAYMAGLPTSALFNLVTMGIPAKLRLNVFEDWVAGRAPKLPIANRASRVAAAAAIEGLTEIPQGMGDQLSQNMGEVAAGVRKPEKLGEKVVASGVLEGLVGAGMGAATGAFSAPESAQGSNDVGGPQPGRPQLPGPTDALEGEFTRVTPSTPRDPDSQAPGGMMGAAVQRAQAEAMQAGIDAAMSESGEMTRVTARTPLEGDVAGTLESYVPDGKGGWKAMILADDGQLRHYTHQDGVQIDGLPGAMDGRSAETQKEDAKAEADQPPAKAEPVEVDEFAPVRNLNLSTGKKSITFPDEGHASLFDYAAQRAQVAKGGQSPDQAMTQAVSDQTGIPAAELPAKADAYRRNVIVAARGSQGEAFVAPSVAGTAAKAAPAEKPAAAPKPKAEVPLPSTTAPAWQSEAAARWTRATDAERTAILGDADMSKLLKNRSFDKINTTGQKRIADTITRRDGGAAAAKPEPVPAKVEAPAPNAEKPAAADVKWFGSQEKADAHIASKGLADTHQVVKNDRRFEIQPKPQNAIAEAAAQAATSPKNDRPEPTQAQKEAGNYAKGHVRVAGMDVSIENPAGTRRQPEWAPLAHDYGYIRRTEGADGDHVDVFLGPDAANADAPVYVIDQINKDGSFDEHKVMLGFGNAKAARDGYHANYQAGWDGFGRIQKMSMGEFKAWVTSPAATKPASPAAAKKVKAEQAAPADAKADKFAGNKLFTGDAVEKARARLRSKLGNLNSGFDPELMMDGLIVAGAYIEAGVRAFPDYAKAMTADLGAGIRPYLLSFYEAARNYPGIDTDGMTPPDGAKKMHSALLKATPASVEAAGTTVPAPKTEKRVTGSGAGRQLRQDWGVENIDGRTPIEGGKNQQTDYGLSGGVKDAFLADAKGYLREVAAQLEKAGYTPYPEKGSKKPNPVSANEGGPAVSGDVSLTMQGPNGTGVYVTVGATALRGVVPTNPQGISVMFRATANGDRYGGSSNQWATPVFTAGDLAETIREHVERDAAPAPAAGQVNAADQAGVAASDQGARAEGVSAPVVEQPARTDAGQPGGAARAERGRRDGDVDGSAQPAGQSGVPGGPDAPVAAVRVAEGGRAGDSAEPGNRANRRALADYRYQPGELTRDLSWKATAERNVQAVELVKQLADSGKPATPEQRALLARFTGWGASEIANGMFPDPRTGQFKPEYRELGERLRKALTDEEYAAARRTTQYAHYTGESVVSSIYSALERFGFAGGRVLEPGAGIGLFKGLMPAGMSANTQYHGIEYDPITGAIAKALYPQSHIQVGDFTETAVPKGHYDAAIGNPPFANVKVTNDPEYRSKSFQLHDYFFAKTIDRVRPGGVVVFVTSKGTMDKASSRARQYLADRADLLGAIRLPQTAFKDHAGTEVVTDILFLQRRAPGTEPKGVAWTGTDTINVRNGRATINEYFSAHPEMVLGEQAMTHGGRYGRPEYSVTPRAGSTIEQQLAAAIDRLPQGVYRAERGSRAERAAVIERDFNPTAKKEGSVYVDAAGQLRIVDQGSGAALTQRINTAGKAVDLKPKEIKFLTDYAGLRDALKRTQYDQLNDGDWEASLSALNQTYAAFVKAHGQVLAHTVSERDNPDGSKTITTRWKNNALLRLDAEDSLVRALEEIREDGTIVPSKLLTARTLNRPSEPQINSVQDALLVALNQAGTLRMADVAKLAGTTEKDAIEQLGSAIYKDPATGWTTADAYLSGNVVRKLKEARQAAKSDPALARNVAALEAVQPAPLSPTDISAQLGAHWVPASDVGAFASEVLGQKIGVTYHPLAKSWSVNEGGPRQVSEWNMEGMSAGEILEAVLNNRQIKITRLVEGEAGRPVSTVDPVGTEQANNIAKKMRGQFSAWLWSSPQRADRLAKFYNEHYNNIVPRSFDGQHLTLPGISSRFALYPHQKRAIWRTIQDGNNYLAHSVGSGKTFTMIAAGMEERRLGLTKRPAYVVPNHMLAQFAREFYELYPTAHIMVADEENFHAAQRQQFVARAGLNDPDAIVITHSAFSRIKMGDEFVDSYVQDQINAYKAIMEEAEDDRITVKQAERRIEQLEKRLSGKADQSKKDKAISFEEIGIDRLYVDEFHEFRKLEFPTNRASVKGIDSSGSQRAMDLHMKVQYLESKKPGRSLVAASGTPVTNTMGELFTAQRFMQPEQLAEDGLDSFDAWAAQFGEVVEGFEQNAAGGYEIVSRFAKFVNVPDLMRRVRSFMDILTSDQLGDLVQRPTVEGGGRQIVVTPTPDGYRAYQKQLEERIKLIRARTGRTMPGDDIILSVISDGRFSAIDMRFVDPTSPSDPNSKLNRMLDDVIRTYHDTADWQYHSAGEKDQLPGGAQMVFTDIGLGEASAKNRGFDMKAWVVKRLHDGGVAPEHIAFMRDNKAHAKKEKLFADMRSGKVRIMIGGKDMETGVNAQKRLVALSHLDSPWFPASVEQREGRGIRQGNQNKSIEIRAYATKGSYDSTMWGMNARKQRFITQALQGNDSVRSMEDVSEASSFEMASALASGDERYLKLAGLRSDVERLGRLYSAYEREQRDMRSELVRLESGIKMRKALVVKLEDAISRRKPLAGDAFTAKVGDLDTTSRDDFGVALYDTFKTLADGHTEGERVIGKIGGFDLVYSGTEMRGSGEFLATVDLAIPGDPASLLVYPIDPDTSIKGLAIRASNQVAGLDRALADTSARITEQERRTEQVQSRVGATFPEMSELAEKSQALSDLEVELSSENVTITEGANGQPAELDAVPEDATQYRDIPASALSAAVPESRRVRTLARLKKLRGDFQRGRIDADKFISEASALADDIDARNLDKLQQTAFSDRVRGADWLRERLLRARRTEELEPTVVDFALWLLDQNPNAANDLGLSIRGGRHGDPAGLYNPQARVATLFASNINFDTAVHEILHHTERMLPPEVQEGIVREHRRAVEAMWKKATPEVRAALEDLMMGALGDKPAWNRAMDGFGNGTLNYAEHYQLTNASEFWAVNATDILSGRFRTRGSWIAKARQWLMDLIEQAKGMLGLRSDAPVLRGLRRVLNGNGDRLSPEMLAARAHQQMRNGTYSDINANPQVDTPAFREWFGKSKVVDANGNPLVVYHGTGANFTVFEPSTDNAIYMSSSPEIANEYANVDNGHVYPVYVRITDPVMVTDMPKFDADRLDDLIQDALNKGHDGLIVTNIRDGWNPAGPAATTYIAFDPEQIKSATGNGGGFDPGNPDIRYSVRSPESLDATRTAREAVTSGPMGEAVSRLVEAGQVQFHGQAPVDAPNGVSAWTNADGTIHMLDSVPAEIAQGVLLHEAFHGRVQPLIGEAAWNQLLGSLGVMARRAARGDGALGKAWTEAMERVQAARKQGDPNIDDAFTPEEFGAYAIENADAMPASVKTWANKVIGSVKAWALRRFGKQLGSITPEQLRALAVASLSDAAAAQRMVTRGQEDVRLYSAQQREEALQQADSETTAAPQADAKPGKSWRGKLNRDISRVRAMFHHPRHIAAIFREFTPVYLTAIDQASARDNIITDLNQDYEHYAALTNEGKANVNAALELGRLTSKVFDAQELAAGVKNPGFRPAVRHDEHGNAFRIKQPIHAATSTAGQTIQLTPQEIAAYGSIRSMFDRALGMFATQVVTEMGFPELAGHQHSPEALNKKVAEITARIESEGGNLKRLTNAAKFMADIAQSQRQGYVPFARYGDYVIAVKTSKAELTYVKHPDGGFLVRGVPATMVNFMEGIGATENNLEDGWRVTAKQRKLIEEENTSTVYAERIETGLSDMLPEARAKWMEGRARDIPAVAKALERISAQWAPEGSNNVVLEPFRVDKKRPEDGIKLTDLDTLAGIADLDAESWGEVRDRLQDAIQGQGFRKHFFNADNVPGYTKDFERSMTDYMAGMSGYLARRQHMDRWDNSIKAIKAERLHDYAVKYRDYTNSPGEEFALMRQAGFFVYIAGSVASGFTNLTQVPLATWFTLGQVVGVARAGVELTRALKDAMKMFRVSRNVGLDMFDPHKAPADVRADLVAAWESGDFVPQATFEIMATAQQRNVGARQWRRNFERFTQVVGLTFSVPERINRITSFIAAHRIARMKVSQASATKVYGKNELFKASLGGDKWTPAGFASFMVDETQFRMGKVNRPTVMRGVGAPLLQFKGYVWQMLELWSRMIRLQGKRGALAAAMSIGMMMGASGIWGFPFADDARKVMESTLNFFLERDVDLKTKLRQTVYDTTGSQWLSTAVGRGAPFASGLDMGRVGMGNIAPQSDGMSDMFGIPYDMLVKRPMSAAAELRNGNPVGAAAAVSPNFVRNLVQAGQYTTRGVRDSRGKMTIAPEQMSNTDVTLKALGWTPTQVTNTRDYAYAQRRMETSTDAYKARMADRIAKTLALMSRTQDQATRAQLMGQIKETYADIEKFNASLAPENRVAVTPGMIRSRIQKEMMGTEAGYGRERRQARGAASNLRELYGVGQKKPATEGAE